MHKKAVGIIAVVVCLLATTSAEAGFLTINLESPDGEVGSAINIGENGNADVAVSEIFEQGQFTFTLNVSGTTDVDPVMSITKTIENTSGLEWIGYQLELDAGETSTFVGTPSSDVFTYDAAASTSTFASFVPPNTVPTGSSVTINFDVLVPDEGPFGFTLTQRAIPIPEPSTLLLGLLAAGAGTAVTLRYRWG